MSSVPADIPRESPPRAPAARFDLLAIDIDGTLLRSDKSLARRDADAIRAAVRAGVRVVLATARPPRATRPILEALGLLEFPAGQALSINYNGALIWDHAAPGGRGAHVDHLPLDAATSRRVVRLARRVDPRVMVWIETLDKWYTDLVDAEFEEEVAGHAEGTVLGGPTRLGAGAGRLGTETSKTFSPDFVGPLDAFLRVPATKIMFLAPGSRLAAVRDAVEHKYARKSLLSLKVSDAHLFSVCHPSADKGLALRMLAHRLGIPRERALAIGDAPNDAGMLRWAGRGLAVANAWDDAKAAADALIDATNDDCAVARAIETHLFECR